MQKPQGSMSFSGKPVVNQETVIAGHGFDINLSAQDDESGIESAFLYRDDTLISALFSSGQSVHHEQPSLPNHSLNYVWNVVDYGKNQASITKIVSAIEDQRPQLQAAILKDRYGRIINTIREGSDFSVDITVQDDVELSGVSIHYGNQQQEQTLQGISDNAVFTLRDNRAVRVIDGHVESILINVLDNAGLVGDFSLDFPVIKDSPPSFDNSQIISPQFAFYSTGGLSKNIALQLLNAHQMDDSGELTIEIFEYSAAGYGTAKPIAKTDMDVGGCTVACSHIVSFTAPSDIAGSNIKSYQMRATDKYDQMALSKVFNIQYSLKPNSIRFVTGDTINAQTTTADKDELYRIKVQDLAMRVVADQDVLFSIVGIDDSTSAREWMAVTDDAGIADILIPMSVSAGRYRLIASLRKHPAILPAVLSITVQPGSIYALKINNIPPVIVGEESIIQVQAMDKGGNRVYASLDEAITFSMPLPEFHFGFTSAGIVEVLNDPLNPIEQYTTSLIDGSENIPFSVGLSSGQYIISVQHSGMQLKYDHDGIADTDLIIVNEIPVSLVSAQPARVLITATEKTNHVLGREDVLEVDESQNVEIEILDKYDNRAVSWLSQDTDITVNLTIDGAGRILNADNEDIQSIQVVRGKANVQVTTSVIEVLALSAADTTSEWALDTQALELNFVKRLPALVGARVAFVHNTLITPLEFTLTEELTPITTEDKGVEISLADTTVAVTTVLESSTLSIIPITPLQLGNCYKWSSVDSSYLGLAANDEMLDQVGDLCTADVAIIPLADNYVVEGRQYTVNYQKSNSINVITGQINIGNIAMAAIVTEGNTLIAPAFSSLPAGSADGTALILSIVSNQKVANSAEIKLLSENGDFDGDGIPNGIEYDLLGLDPAKADTDGNGIDDGDEDLDGDGLTNLEEVIATTKLNDTDSDNDGLTDRQEVNVYSTDPWLSDTDDDGLPDYVEVISDSEPTDANVREIDPFYITGIEIIEDNLAIDLAVSDSVAVTVEADFEHEGNIFRIDISDFYELLEFNSSDNTVAIFENDKYNAKKIGLTELRVIFIENDDFYDVVNLEVTNSAPEPGGQDTVVIASLNGDAVSKNINEASLFLEFRGGILPEQLLSATVDGEFIDTFNDCDALITFLENNHHPRLSPEYSINEIPKRDLAWIALSIGGSEASIYFSYNNIRCEGSKASIGTVDFREYTLQLIIRESIYDIGQHELALQVKRNGNTEVLTFKFYIEDSE
ncbi:MAG: hypothetical protein COA78_32010 [Blastopirellula sp.]|nr:MAG: hypothetical protein COA78_32010 [Blastopirellula sp.]